MAQVVTGLIELVERVDAWRDGRANVAIGVEGASTAGKTMLARQLAGGDEAFAVSLDCYRIPGVLGPTYGHGVRRTDLLRDLTKLERRFDVVVVEGIALREVLGDEWACDRHIYVKRMSSAGVWNDDPELGPPEVPGQEESIQHCVDLWSYEYHLEYLPHERADLVFERVESESAE